MWKIYAIYGELRERCLSVIFKQEEVRDYEKSTDLRATQILGFNSEFTVYWLWELGHNTWQQETLSTYCILLFLFFQRPCGIFIK